MQTCQDLLLSVKNAPTCSTCAHAPEHVHADVILTLSDPVCMIDHQSHAVGSDDDDDDAGLMQTHPQIIENEWTLCNYTLTDAKIYFIAQEHFL